MDFGVSESVWKVEFIPDDHLLYLRVHMGWFRKDGRVAPGFFKNRPDEHTGAMSTDWSKYSTPHETRARARKPAENAVGQLGVSEVRRIPEQTVIHSPIQFDDFLPDNRAHTDVRGPKEDTDLDVQDQFTRICRIVLQVDS